VIAGLNQGGKVPTKWDNHYSSASGPGEPALVLSDHQHLLPSSGKALDLACGLGANAILLAKHGLEAHAWDSSPGAIQSLVSFTKDSAAQVHASVRDILIEPPTPNQWNVITVSHFLERQLCPAIIDALIPGGLLFYQTFTEERVDDSGPNNKDYLLGENELLELFSMLVVRFYREEGRIGNASLGQRNKAYLVGQKPTT
jgi:SAM-dependent methyltransferase